MLRAEPGGVCLSLLSWLVRLCSGLLVMSWLTSAIGLATFRRPRRPGETPRLGETLLFLAGEREVETEPRLVDVIRLTEGDTFLGDRDLTPPAFGEIFRGGGEPAARL